MSSAQYQATGEYLYREPAPEPEAAPAPRPLPGLLDSIIEGGQIAQAEEPPRLGKFLASQTIGEGLRAWFGTTSGLEAGEVLLALGRDIAYIDELLSDQVSEILHHPKFQRLESSWRGLRRLVEGVDAEGAAEVKVRVLSVTWRELERDFEKAVDFDQSSLFKKVYEDEFGTPGGEPFGALIGDYEIHPRPSRQHQFDDITVLTEISRVAAAAFCPFLTAASPEMFELENFSEFERMPNLERTFDSVEYLKWKAFRDSEDSRFVGLTLPRTLMRGPYLDQDPKSGGFRFVEEVAGTDRRKYLWGNAAYALGEVLIRTFSRSGWLADIRGVERGVDGGGLVTTLPVDSFRTDKMGVAPKASTDVVITDEQERELSEAGFIPLCHCHDTEFSAFYSNLSVQKAKKYDRPEATANARLSAMLQYMLCVSRFTHYLKVIARNKIGRFAEPDELEDFLQRWIVQYVTADQHASAETKSRYPLREARVNVRPDAGKPGSYRCTMHLWPHFELDELNASMRVRTELAAAREE